MKAISTHATTAIRPVILHAHMFKNAGTTLDWSLHRCFGTDFVDHRDDDAMREHGNYLATYLGEHPRIKALSSHWLPLPLTLMPPLQPQLLMLLRNPLERVRSVYNFERSQQGINGPGNTQAQALSFKEYVEWRLEPGTGPALKNFHTRYCSGDYFGRDMERLYEQALGNLDKFPLLGLVHRYAESMVVFEAALCDAFPSIDLSWKIQNTSQAPETSVEERVDAIADELGNTFESLLAANTYDLKLLQHCEHKFDRELNKITDIDTRLQSMRRRSEQLNE